MNELEDRLAALDPAAGQPYEHRNLDAMIARVISQHSSPRTNLWRRFQVKMAGALVTSALVTTGAIVAIQGAGPALPLLAIQSIHSGQGFKSVASTHPGTYGAMQIYEVFNFTAGPGLTASTPTNFSYQLQIPSNAASEASRVAAIFGVTGTPAVTNGDGSNWTVTNASGSSLDYQNSAIPQWNYTSSLIQSAYANSSSSPSGNNPNHTTLEGDVQSYLAEMGYGYNLSSPNFSTSTIGTANPDGTIKTATSAAIVSYNVVVGGITTDQSLSFTVDTNNNVLYASGPAFSVGNSYNYPLQSLSAGVAALNAEQQNRFQGSSTQPTPLSGSSVNPGSNDTGTTTPTGPPSVNVTLNSDSLSFQTYQLTDGTLWLLPVYQYAGTITGTDATSTTSTWSELAVDPNYIRISSTATAGGGHGVINF